MKNDHRVMPICLVVSGLIMFIFDYAAMKISSGDYSKVMEVIFNNYDLVRIIVELVLIAAICFVLRRCNDRDTAMNSALLVAIYVLAVFALERIMIAMGVKPIIAYVAQIPLTVLEVLNLVLVKVTHESSYTAILLMFECITPFLMALATKSKKSKGDNEEPEE
jgi:hypothetical protein